jgi:hypothetical protein
VAKPAHRVFAGLFLVSFATLCFEILLTRIFSVTLWYHFAFIAVSVAMFGMTAGALAVYLRPAWFPAERTAAAMGWSAAGFGLTLAASVLAHLALPTSSPLRLSVTYAVTVVPFFFSGVCVCLALTRYPAAANRLYAVDLAGAALGCGGYVALLSVMDGISAVFATAALAVAAGFVFLPGDRKAQRQACAVLLAFACLITAASNVAFLQKQPLVRFAWVKVGPEYPPVFERWNAFSRITVHKDAPDTPVLWGASPALQAGRTVNQAWLRMDALAGTVLTEFKGDLREVDYLRYDITNVAHHLRPGGRTLVLGAGGGRDVLSALVFGAPQVVAVEINGVILDTVNRRFGDFTGHLDRLPGVTFVHDEARSWVQRSSDRFDVIQASWIDTWAATAAGALALTENSLYTLEAWQSFLDRLSPRGLLTFTRAYEENDPREAARLASLARSALAARGVAEPGRHLMLVVNRNLHGAPVRGNATIVVSASPYTPADVARMRSICDRLGFRLAVARGLRDQAEPVLWAAATGEGLEELRKAWLYRLDAPTDDRPFFFNLLSLTRLPDLSPPQGMDGQATALRSLLGLLLTVAVLSLACIAAPLAVAARTLRPEQAERPLAAYFAAIGLGFMFVELALLQRLSLFLGNPAYGIGVALFSLLLASGAGSALAALLALEALALPHVLALAQAAGLPARLAVSVAARAARAAHGNGVSARRARGRREAAGPALVMGHQRRGIGARLRGRGDRVARARDRSEPVARRALLSGRGGNAAAKGSSVPPGSERREPRRAQPVAPVAGRGRGFRMRDENSGGAMRLHLLAQ